MVMDALIKERHDLDFSKEKKFGVEQNNFLISY